ncbi:IS21 family transposase [Geothrix sp. PMB-07]|uniref:IS21 family transposase n=1 Tax=Geothrix sp. PMB-07 TaxID=3068640 RepID=UPI0027422DE7|nr:IS21 family transposase [Geothrix sp. PMB-07]WLT32820.1 IS21 family transposase [Geothrix sp. PMB-07]
MSLRTVEREVQPFRQAWEWAQKATLRFETMPGKQMQVDFGEKWLRIEGERQKRYVFVATLGFSRRCYIEISGSLRQRDWIMGLEHAFRHFGGVPEEILTDNVKPLVLGRKGGRPQFHPEFEAFCRHWGVVPRACQPFRARTKGKVENVVGYAKGNALGRLEWESDEALDKHLTWWMRAVADVRVHGTTHERPIDRFEMEKVALKPLGNHPSHLRVRHFTQKASSDGRIDVDTNRYSVPPQFVGITLEVRVEFELIQVMSRGVVIAEHTVHPGRHQVIEDPGHVEGLVGGAKASAKPCEIRRPWPTTPPSWEVKHGRSPHGAAGAPPDPPEAGEHPRTIGWPAGGRCQR